MRELPKPVKLRFYFDFSCPYAYVASARVEAFARRVGVELDPRPMLLGGVFRELDTPQNLSDTLSPSKAHHNFADMHRQAAAAGVPLNIPAGHPIRTVQALRVLLVVGPPFLPLAHHLFRAYWVEGIDISTHAGLAQVLREAGFGPGRAEAVLAQAQSPEVKAELRSRTDEAIAAGVFGIPSFVLDSDLSNLYWGVDRLPMIAARLGTPEPPPAPLPLPAHPIDLYFDYSSPFAYIGCVIAERLFGDAARWRPMLLGAVFKSVGTVDVPLFTQSEPKRRHTRLDLERQAADAGLEFRFPSRFPMTTVLALRVTLAAGGLEGAAGRRLVHAIFRAYWADDRNIADPEVMRAICAAEGLDAEALLAAAGSPGLKSSLRTATSEAVDAGVFGAPTVVVHRPEGRELFWGADRIPLALAAARG